MGRLKILFLISLPVFLSGLIGWFLDKKLGIQEPVAYWALGAMAMALSVRVALNFLGKRK